MANWKKLAQGAAGAAGAGEALNVEDVFSTYLYEGNATQRDITNGIDLDGEGGLVWVKNRSTSVSNHLYDTERGATKRLMSDATNAEYSTAGYGVTGFNTDGFELGTHSAVNNTGDDYASWTFRKAPKFFDVVTYTGNATFGTTISHNLGVAPGMIWIKRTDSSEGWFVYHRSVYGTNGDTVLYLDQYWGKVVDANAFGDAFPTATEFTLGAGNANANGGQYVAYLFAHNDGDGDFGPTGDQDIIQCGSYTGNGSSSNGTEVDLGFEPQWIMIKRTDQLFTAGMNWFIFDAMRGMPVGGADQYVSANLSDAEAGSSERFQITPTGFKLATTSGSFNDSGGTYIYIAIRRGPMAVPESADDVFATETWGATSSTAPAFYSGWPVDAALNRSYATTANNSMIARLTDNKAYFTNSTSNGTFGSAGTLWDLQDGLWDQTGTVSTYVSHMWRRAPNFFDVVAYEGNGTAGRTVSHNLGVAPEMMWVRRRDSSDNWLVYHSGLDVDGDGRPETDALVLDTNGAAFDYNRWNDTAPTATEFTVHSDSVVNGNGGDYIAFLFASLDGISKVGTYTGNASDQNIDCGFSNGARLVIIKAADNGTEWYLFSDGMGITTATDDPIIILNSNSSEDEEYTGYSGAVSPYSGGFKVIGNNNEVNKGDGRTYIFYAVA